MRALRWAAMTISPSQMTLAQWLQAELTAGINHTSLREGYLPIFDVLARWSCDVLMGELMFMTANQPYTCLPP